MKKNQIVDISDQIDGINTSETYSDKFFLFGTTLLAPYINLDFMRGGITDTSDLKSYIEFSYLFFCGITEIIWMGEN